MLRSLFWIVIAFSLHSVNGQLCGNNTEQSCTTQILGKQQPRNKTVCQMDEYPPNSPQCGSMAFGPLVSNTQIGGVTLRPHIINYLHTEYTRPYSDNRTVLNITFSNIKWTTMKFRFQDKYRATKNHCRNIVISKDVTVNDRSVLYYDCYWRLTDDRDGQSHILDFEAANDWSTYRGQYYFNIPSAEMLSHEVSESEWKPFIYIEIFLTKMRLHVTPPPSHLKIIEYDIKVVKECGKPAPCVVQSDVKKLRNKTDDVSYDYNFVGNNGSYSFVVTPMHDAGCLEVSGVGCRTVESPKITISSEPQALNICIASVTALIVATLFAYYVVLRYLRKYWCKDYRLAIDSEIPTPPKVLVIYPPTSRLHAECVASFVSYLRAEYGFTVLHDGDAPGTAHADPHRWAEDAVRAATHVLYIAGPAEDSNLHRSIYERPILSAHRDVDALLLSFIRTNRVSDRPKDVMNVRFEYSTGRLPPETSRERVFVLLRDWQKLISHLSKNMLPKRQIMRTEKGRCFLDDLTRAKKLLNAKNEEVVLNCEKSMFEKKILL